MPVKVGQRAKVTTPQAAPPAQDAYALLQQIAQQMNNLSSVVSDVALRVGQLEAAKETAAVQAVVAPRLEPTVHAPATREERQAAVATIRAEVVDEKEAFWQRIKTQPKRMVNFSATWETEMYGVPIAIVKGLRMVPEEVAQAYESYILKMQRIDAIDQQWQALAQANPRDPGTMRYEDLGVLMHQLGAK